MKNSIIILLVILSSVFTLQSCDDFLDVKPRNTKVVKTVQDYRDILASYMSWLKGINEAQFTIMGGANNYPNFDQTQHLAFYTGEVDFWENQLLDKDTEALVPYAKTMLSWTGINTDTWTQNYQFLGQINFIVEDIDNAQIVGDDDASGQEHMRRFVKGEALVWRAYTYFKTLQYYSPYGNNELGIPIDTKAYLDPVHTTVSRATQKEVYTQIISDCNQALDLMEETPTNAWNFAYDEQFIYAMLTNIYMYKAMSGGQEESDWDNAILYADKALTNRTLTNSPDVLRDMFNLSQVTGLKKVSTDETFIRIVKEHAFRFPFDSGYAGSTFGSNTANTVIYNSYTDDDIRKGVYFKDLGTNIINDKYNLFGGSFQYSGVFIPFRLADIYLIKAEALLRTDKIGEAKIVLDEFKQSRYAMPVPAPSSKDELLTDILKERKLEFYHENDKRWLDMKRLGERFDRGEIGEVSFVLEADDFRYSYPIPVSDLKEGSDIQQNPGWEELIN